MSCDTAASSRTASRRPATRVSGHIGGGSFNQDCRDNGCDYWGTGTLVGPDGQWVGSFAGLTVGADMESSGLRVLTGNGAYAGWTYATHSSASAAQPLTISGYLYPGPSPVWGPVPGRVARRIAFPGRVVSPGRSRRLSWQ
jgi:hypothetical protein